MANDNVHQLVQGDLPRSRGFRGNDDGSDGGDGMLERVAKLESDVEYIKRDVSDIKGDLKSAKTDISAIKQDLAVLKERSENFASKNDLDTLIARSENFATKTDIQTVRTEIQTAIAGQTKWIAATIIGTTAIALAIARFLFV
ncbi:hypothetical protein [Pectobacterium punjabense]|uniref:hypothetical protein n=1 Tax=Pectobacterium punjabense TaxID=2108399 RepID=UPI003D9BB9AB